MFPFKASIPLGCLVLIVAVTGQAWAVAASSAEAAVRYAKAEIRAADFPKDAMPLYTARVLAGVDPAETLKAADHMLEVSLVEKLDPFNLHAIVHAERVGGERWPSTLRAKFRAYAARWDFTKPIGVSLNYELMRDGAGWIAAGVWPDLVDTAGNNAARIRELCGARLRKTLAAIPREGATEYDAPLYYGTDFMALRLLADFADEPDLRDSARHCLEWMLVQTGAHWHRGYAVTSAGRAKYWGSQQVCPDAPGATTAMAWMLFGGDRDAHIEGVPQGFWMSYPSPWLSSLDWLSSWQSALPVPRAVQASVLISSHGFYVRKQAWITSGYGLASQRTDGTAANSYLYKEARNVVLRWVSEKPASTFIVFQENRRRPQEKIANAFAYGENPYAQTLQHEGTVLGVYDVPADYGFSRLIAPFTTHGAILARVERDGWVCAHGGSVLFAFRSLTPAHWLSPDHREGLDLYASDAARGGWVLETVPVAGFAGGGVEAELARFAEAMVTRTKLDAASGAAPQCVVFTNLAGHHLELTWKSPEKAYAGECRMDGRPIDYAAFPLLDLPTAHQPLGKPLIVQTPAGPRTL